MITFSFCFTRVCIEQVGNAKCMFLTVNLDLDRGVNLNLSLRSRSGSECESDTEPESEFELESEAGSLRESKAIVESEHEFAILVSINIFKKT